MSLRHEFPRAARLARLLGFRSLSAMCRARGIERAKLYRALHGNEGARTYVETLLGADVARALFEGSRS